MEKKSLMLGTVAGVFIGSLLAGSIAFAATTAVQAQKETVNYGGIQGTGLVYGGTTYAELYAIQQVLKQQGVVNHWTGSSFTMDSSSKSNTELASQNNQLSQQVSDLGSILKNLSKVPASEQQQIISKLSQAASSSQSTTALQTMAQGLQNALSQTSGNPGAANNALQNLLNGGAGSKNSANAPGYGGIGPSATSGTSGTSGTSTSGGSTVTSAAGSTSTSSSTGK